MTIASATAAAEILEHVAWEHIHAEDRPGLSILYPDLDEEDLDDLQEALRLATARPMLYASDTGDVLRAARREEIIESILAGPEGHITVDGQRVYADQGA